MTERKPIIFFDLDDTILDFRTAEETALRKALSKQGIELTAESLAGYRIINGQMWERLENGLAEKKDICVERHRLFFEKYGFNASAEETEKAYEAFLHIGHYFMPGAEELLEALQGRYELYIITNGFAEIQDSRIASAGIAKYFENIFISDRIGANKPSREFFSYCFNSIKNFDKDRCIIVGDSLTSDIKGGINTGLMTCWYNHYNHMQKNGIRPTYEIKELNQLPRLLTEVFG